VNGKKGRCLMLKGTIALATGLILGAVAPGNSLTWAGCSDYSFTYKTQASWPTRNVESCHKVWNNATSGSELVCVGIQEGADKTYNIDESSIEYWTPKCQTVVHQTESEVVTIYGLREQAGEEAGWTVEVAIGWWCGTPNVPVVFE